MKSAGKARSNGLYRHIRTSKEIIRNLLNDYEKHNGSGGRREIGILHRHEASHSRTIFDMSDSVKIPTVN